MIQCLSVENLSVKYDSATALDSVTAHIDTGQVVGLIGPNGAGKTSFIKAICGRIKAEGTIKIEGKVLKHGMNRQALIGLVPQEIGLYPHLTCYENLSVFASIMGLSKSEKPRAMQSALQAVSLTDKKNARVSTLSGGIKRRLNVAIAIMHKPKLIILDEPTAGTDMPARDSIHRLTRNLAQSGMGVLLVTHELEQVEALCDRILILAKGRLLSDGPPAQILENCFGNMRELVIRFSKPPQANLLNERSPFRFTQGELPTIWHALTNESQSGAAIDFLNRLQSENSHVQEIAIRRPGLPVLMQTLETTGQLPYNKPEKIFG